MQYVGIKTQQSRNNMRSTALLLLFPVLVMGLVMLFFVILYGTSGADYQSSEYGSMMGFVWPVFLQTVPWVLGFVALWFTIAYFANSAIIKNATGSRPLDRKENKRVYNLVENLCMSQGMSMPKVNVIRDSSLNAFASGINQKSYTVTLTSGIIEKLDDQELEGVIAHELSHIRNRDVRLLIVSIVFVGIFAMIAQIAFRMIGRVRLGNNKKGGGAAILLIVAILAAVGYGLATLMRFAISRKREYLADAGAAEMTRNPGALAMALRKISGDPRVESVQRDDVAQLFIEHPLKGGKKRTAFNSLFATHPPIERRIEVLEQF